MVLMSGWIAADALDRDGVAERSALPEIAQVRMDAELAAA